MASDPRNDVTPFQLMLSSWAGAMLTSVVGKCLRLCHDFAEHVLLSVTPLDVIKIRMQAQDKEMFTKKKCFLYCNGLMDHLCYCNGNGNSSANSMMQRAVHGNAAVPPYKWFLRPGKFNGTFDAFAKIIRNEGVLSLWSGLPPTLVMALPGTMIYFTMYDQIRSKICRHFMYSKDVPPLWVPGFSGAVARTVACTFISPLEMIRTKMQSKRLQYSVMFRAIKSSVEQQGLLSLYRGLSPMLMRDVPFSALYWLNYEFIKKHFNQPQPTFWFALGAGATSGSFAALVTLPFDVVKTRRQIEFGEKELFAENGSSKKTSTMHIMRQIHGQNGIPGLFVGIVPRLVKVAPACAIMISTYEFGKSFFRKFNSSGKDFFEYVMR